MGMILGLFHSIRHNLNANLACTVLDFLLTEFLELWVTSWQAEAIAVGLRKMREKNSLIRFKYALAITSEDTGTQN